MAYNSINIKPYIKSHLELQREITLIELAPSPYCLSKVLVLHICTCLQGLMKIQLRLFKILRKQNVTDGRTLTRTDNMKTVYPPQTKFAGGYKNLFPEHYQSVKLYGSISGPIICWPDLGPNSLQRLSADYEIRG